MFAHVKFNLEGEYDTTSKFISVDSGYTYDDGEIGPAQSISFDIDLDAKISSGDEIETVPSPDFPISLGFKTSKTYGVSASFREAPPDKERVDGVLRFNVDVSRRCAQSSMGRSSAGGIKRKLSSMQWS